MRIKVYGKHFIQKRIKCSFSCCKNMDHYTCYLFGYNLLSISGIIWRILLLLLKM